jgi:hypothetical protein
MSKTWFITGASRGFGRDTYGDAVLPIRLDVTDRAADFAAVEQAAEHFGTLDVVINNAGYGHFGMIEELAEDAEVREAQSRSWADKPGDPRATRSAILKVVDADDPPLRIFFGRAPIEVVTKEYESRLATWNAWQPVSIEAYGA